MIAPKNYNNSFLDQGSYGCTIYPRIKCRPDDSLLDKRKKYVSKLTINDFFAKNEINMGLKLQNIENNTKKQLPFIYVSSSCNVSTYDIASESRKYDFDIKKECEIFKLDKSKYYQLSKESKYIVLYTRYVKSVTHFEYLRTTYNQNERVSILLKYYGFLINSISYFVSSKIVHNDLHEGNILVSTNTKPKYKYYIIDFGISIDINKLFIYPQGTEKINIEYLKPLLIMYKPSINIWPIERHILCYYVFKSEDGKIPSNIINTIVTLYVEKTLIPIMNNVPNQVEPTRNLSIKLKKHYYNKFNRKYGNKSVKNTEKLMVEILKNSVKTWDLYHVSIYIHDYIIRKYISKEQRERKLGFLYELIYNSINHDYMDRPLVHNIRDKYISQVKKMKSRL